MNSETTTTGCRQQQNSKFLYLLDNASLWKNGIFSPVFDVVTSIHIIIIPIVIDVSIFSSTDGKAKEKYN